MPVIINELEVAAPPVQRQEQPEERRPSPARQQPRLAQADHVARQQILRRVRLQAD